MHTPMFNDESSFLSRDADCSVLGSGSVKYHNGGKTDERQSNQNFLDEIDPTSTGTNILTIK
jgi:hypothetical protein